MARLLIVDDENNIVNLIKKYAVHEGHQCDTAANGEEAIEKCEENEYDVVLLDVMMPYVNGFQALEEIRRFSSVPVIMLTAKGEEYDKIKGFDLGVDDYVVKPFSIKELMMRINAILKRVNKYKKDADVFRDLKLDYLAYSVSINDQTIEFSPKELQLLFLLARNQNKVLSRESLISDIWGYDYDGDDRTLDTHIKLIRKKLGDYKDCIKTVRGVGYRFEFKE